MVDHVALDCWYRYAWARAYREGLNTAPVTREFLSLLATPDTAPQYLLYASSSFVTASSSQLGGLTTTEVGNVIYPAFGAK